MSEEEITAEEMKTVLEDANILESNMSTKEIKDLYKVIKQSKNSAIEETESRLLSTSQENVLKTMEDDDSDDLFEDKQKSFSPRMWSFEKKINENLQIKNDGVAEASNSIKDATKTIFGFNEMLGIRPISLDIVTHKAKFVSIQNSSDFLQANIKTKAQKIFAYHSRLHNLKDQLARKSFIRAPIPKSINLLDYFSGITNEVDFEETYISRSGRHTKRKVYIEDSQDDISFKKIKNDKQEWSSKSIIKTDKPKVSSVTRKTENSPVVNDSINGEKPDEKSDKANKIAVANSSTPVSLKKLTNSEIMTRSKLFSPLPNKRSTRSETLFDNLVEETEKKNKQEKAMERFDKTLDEDKNEEDIITLEDEPVPRRVIPPVPRRAISGRKRVKLNDGHPTNSEHKSNSDSTKPLVKRNLNAKKSSDLDTEPSTSKDPVTSNHNITCPICQKEFDESRIESHASKCGEESEPSAYHRTTCEYCDIVLSPLMDYQSHIRDCKEKKSRVTKSHLRL